MVPLLIVLFNSFQLVRSIALSVLLYISTYSTSGSDMEGEGSIMSSVKMMACLEEWLVTGGVLSDFTMKLSAVRAVLDMSV